MALCDDNELKLHGKRFISHNKRKILMFLLFLAALKTLKSMKFSAFYERNIRQL